MTPTVHVLDDVPTAYRDAVGPLLTKWAGLVPCWCREITVGYDGGDAENAAKVSAEPEYRRAWIDLCPEWLADADDMEKNLVHELLHLPLKPMTNFVHELIEQAAHENPPLAQLMESEWRKCYEGAVEDLREAVMG